MRIIKVKYKDLARLKSIVATKYDANNDTYTAIAMAYREKQKFLKSFHVNTLSWFLMCEALFTQS